MIGQYVGAILCGGVKQYVKRALLADDVIYKISHVYECGCVNAVCDGDLICRNSVNGFKIAVEVFFLETVAVEVACTEKIYARISR